MYLNAKAINEFYPQLNTAHHGKLNLERTSSLAYFIALKKVQKEQGIQVVNLHKDSIHRKKFTEAVTKYFVLHTEGKTEYQANYLGEINIDDNTMATKTGKNFFSTQVNGAAKQAEPVNYPTRPADSPILKLGMETENGKSGVVPHEDWQNNLINFINVRNCGDDTFPFVLFLLRDHDFNTSLPAKDSIEQALKKEFPEDLANFLLEHADIPDSSLDPYISEKKWAINDLDQSLFNNLEKEEEQKGVTMPTPESYPTLSIDNTMARNRIIYGAPGTGKSYFLGEEVEDYFQHNELYERVTFYPNYSYSQFIGSYKPVPLYKETSNKIYKPNGVEEADQQLEPVIDYQFVPGPFISMLLKALRHPDSSFVLIIEEINRSNAASVFGDAFQLLDRNENGESDYAITFNTDVMNYLRRNGIYETKIKLPENFFIWATMNSADQGVTPMDTAFKRRWSFEYLPLNKNEKIMAFETIHLPFLKDEDVYWNRFRKVINDHIKDYVTEDKLIGPFFLKPYELKDPEVTKNKLLLYLRDDVLRYNYNKLFKKKTFSDIAEDFDQEENIFVFSEDELRSDQ